MILNGKEIAKTIEDRIRKGIDELKGRKPALAFVLVGNNEASLAYIRMKKKKCEQVGILSKDRMLDETTSQSELLDVIKELNQDETVDGILVQLPLPGHIETKEILQAIDPNKDVDGFHPINMGKLLIGDKSGFFPCTPYGIQILLKQANIDVEGKHVVILGRSNIVGKPLAALLMQKEEGANASVTVLHSRSENLAQIAKEADILIAAIGQAGFVKSNMVKEGAIVIDVGINRTENGLVGDVDFEGVSEKTSAITPVPGGIGPMTIAMLLSNTLLSYQRSEQ